MIDLRVNFLDSNNGFRNVSHQQLFFSELPSPRRSHNTLNNCLSCVITAMINPTKKGGYRNFPRKPYINKSKQNYLGSINYNGFFLNRKHNIPDKTDEGKEEDDEGPFVDGLDADCSEDDEGELDVDCSVDDEARLEGGLDMDDPEDDEA